MYRKGIIFLAIFITAVFVGCKQSKNENQQSIDLNSLKQIDFFEVRRTFDNGYVFNDIGFQQEPEWRIKFLSADSVQAFNPKENKMETFHLLHDHDQVFNFAGEWFRIKFASKDSLILQRLQVNNKVVMKDVRSNVYMKFYAANILKKLETTVEKLRIPLKKDSAFVLDRISKANKNIFDSIYFFAARNAVRFIPKSNQIEVRKTDNSIHEIFSSKSYSYLYPEYKVVITKAYKDFSYYIKAIVDKNGKVFVYDFAAMDDYRENRRKVIQGILDVYLNELKIIQPGNTLGFKHSSVIAIDLIGKK